MKVARENREKSLFFHDFQSTVSPTIFIKPLHIIHQINRLFLCNPHIFIFGQDFSFTGCPLKNVFWISSAIPKIAGKEKYFFLHKSCDISESICVMKNCI